jgi:hypothetical protein
MVGTNLSGWARAQAAIEPGCEAYSELAYSANGMISYFEKDGATYDDAHIMSGRMSTKLDFLADLVEERDDLFAGCVTVRFDPLPPPA